MTEHGPMTIFGRKAVLVLTDSHDRAVTVEDVFRDPLVDGDGMRVALDLDAVMDAITAAQRRGEFD